MADKEFPPGVIFHKSQITDYQYLKNFLEDLNIPCHEGRVFAEVNNRKIIDEVPVAIALINEDDQSGIEFLRATMRANIYIQRLLAATDVSMEIVQRAVNKAHINYLIRLPLNRDKFYTYLKKSYLRYNDYIRPLIRFDALTQITEDLLVDNKKFRHEAKTDGLTHLLNRRSFDSILNRLYQRYIEQGLSFCLALIDLDYFKKVNDSYGHPAGDMVLQKVAEILQKNQRLGIDFAFRYGGEEFAIISTNISPVNMVGYVSRLLELVRNSVFHFEGQDISVTFSAGICQSCLDETPETLVINADLALLKAKESGRNQVLVFDQLQNQIYPANEIPDQE